MSVITNCCKLYSHLISKPQQGWWKGRNVAQRISTGDKHQTDAKISIPRERGDAPTALHTPHPYCETGQRWENGLKSPEPASREPDSTVTDTRETLPHTGRVKQLHLLKAALCYPHMHCGT